MVRVAVYVDGFNLYHSMESLGNARLKWLDLRALVNNHLKPNEVLEKVSYFTALATWNEEKQLRHKKYLRALALTSVSVTFGHFKTKNQTCSNCGFRYKGHEEKRTDVNIAVSLLRGAILDEFDTAILISGDTDLIPALQTLKDLYPAKRVGVLFPHRRHTAEMEKAADFSETIKAEILLACRLPEKLLLPSGKFLTPPEEWS